MFIGLWRMRHWILSIPVLAMAMVFGAPDTMAKLQGREWIAVTGTATGCEGGSITLDYGTGLATIQLNQLAWCLSGEPALTGRDVTVYGFVSLLDSGTVSDDLRPVAVYVHDVNTIYYGTSIDIKVGHTVYGERIHIRAGDPLNAIGMVTKISGEEFRLDTGETLVYVDTGKMTYDPMDAEGTLRLREGDVVSVEGYMDRGPLNRYEIQARRIVRLSP